MGLTLVVYPAGRFNKLRTFPLTSEKLTLGLGPDVRVPLDAPNVHASHATLSCRGGEWFIQGDEDCSVGEVPLAEDTARVVRAGDPIRVGDVLMELRVAANDDLLGGGSSDEYLRPPPWPTVRVTEGPSVGHVLALREEGRVYIVGRGEKCDLSIDDRNVSREHVEIVRKKDGIMVMDRTSTRGTWVGYSRLVPQRRARWDGRRMLKLGVTVLVVDEPAERVAEHTLRALEPAPSSISHLSTKSLSYEDEGRDATAVSTHSGVAALPVLSASGSIMPAAPSRRPPPPSAAKTVLKVFALLVLAGVVAAVIGLVALLSR